MFKQMLTLIGGMALALSVLAADVAIKPDHPDVYVVRKGDTLWSIAGRFLIHPWQWPEIWQANPQVQNPHRIYPGDRLSLSYRDGRARLGVERLSPRIRAESLDDAITAIPLAAVRPFLEQVGLTDADGERRMPYVVALEENRLRGTEGQVAYVRGLDAEPGTRVVLSRVTMEFWEVPKNWPWDTAERRADGIAMRGDPIFNRPVWYWADTLNWSFRDRNADHLGTELLQVGAGEVLRANDSVTTVLITGADMEIAKGDRVRVGAADPFDLTFMPRAPDQVPENMRVMAVTNTGFTAGPNDVVALSKGARDGVANGQVYSIFHPGERIDDDIKYPSDEIDRMLAGDGAKIQLPAEYVARVMVFRTFEKMSYGLIVEGIRPVVVNDELRAPLE